MELHETRVIFISINRQSDEGEDIILVNSECRRCPRSYKSCAVIYVTGEGSYPRLIDGTTPRR
jgi:hypothetical protein